LAWLFLLAANRLIEDQFNTYLYRGDGTRTRKTPKAAGQPVINLDFDNMAKLRRVREGSTDIEVYDYDQLHRRVLSQKPGMKAIDMTYAYNARGQVTSTVNNAIGGDNRSYYYDNLGRLSGAFGPWGSARYVYDALGNIVV
jgi:YD repeat-containing protein